MKSIFTRLCGKFSFNDAIALVFIAFILAEFAAPSTEKPTVPLAQADVYMQKEWASLKEMNLVDGVMLIEKDGKIIFSKGDPEECYPVASISKSVVGFRFYELQQNNKVDLDEKVCRWLQNFCTGKLKSISLNHLLAHRGGFGRDLSFSYFVQRLVDSDWNLNKLDDLMVSDSNLNAAPGTEFNYSNFGYLLLSRVLEKIEGKTFSEIVKDLAGRHHLSSLSAALRGKTFPVSILIPGTSLKWTFEIEGDAYKSFGTGGIVMNARDLLQWLKILETKAGLSLKAEQKYQRGVVIGDKSFWHNGATLGMYGFIATVVEQKMKVVILSKNFKPTKKWTNAIENFETIFY